MAPVLVSIGRIVHYLEANPLKDEPGAAPVVARAALVQLVHESAPASEDERVDLCVFGPGGPTVVVNVLHAEPEPEPEHEKAPAKKGQATAKDGKDVAPAAPLLTGTVGTWRWPPRTE